MAKMKLQKIADLSLKNMIITYHDTNRTRFDMDFFTTLFTEETQDVDQHIIICHFQKNK